MSLSPNTFPNMRKTSSKRLDNSPDRWHALASPSIGVNVRSRLQELTVNDLLPTVNNKCKRTVEQDGLQDDDDDGSHCIDELLAKPNVSDHTKKQSNAFTVNQNSCVPGLVSFSTASSSNHASTSSGLAWEAHHESISSLEATASYYSVATSRTSSSQMPDSSGGSSDGCGIVCGGGTVQTLPSLEARWRSPQTASRDAAPSYRRRCV
jgi:hypothetical protein